MAWDAVHAAQGGEKSVAAEGRLSDLDAATLQTMLEAARKTCDRAKDIYAQTLASDVVALLGRLHAPKMTNPPRSASVTPARAALPEDCLVISESDPRVVRNRARMVRRRILEQTMTRPQVDAQLDIELPCIE